MFTRNKITKQSIAITASIILWVIFFLWTTNNDFKRISIIDEYQNEAIQVKSSLNIYISGLIDLNTSIQDLNFKNKNEPDFEQALKRREQIQAEYVNISQAVLQMNKVHFPERRILDNSHDRMKKAADTLDALSQNILLESQLVSGSNQEESIDAGFIYESLAKAHMHTENLDKIIYLTEKNRLSILKTIKHRTFTSIGILIIMVAFAYVWIVHIKVMYPLKKIRNEIGVSTDGYHQKAITNSRMMKLVS